jgi:hypothetical protein
MKRSILVSAAICALTLTTHSTRAQDPVSYTFTSINVPFSGASNTKAFAINPAGDIVGRFFDGNEGGKPRGFLRHSDGTFAPPIDVPVANAGTVPRGIDAPGDIVGKYFDYIYPNETHGFFLSAGGAFTSFDVTLSGAIAGSTVANSLNNRGQIVGSYIAPTLVTGCGTTAIPVAQGFLRNTDGTFTPIDFPGATATDARGTDDSGNIVGFYVTVPSTTTPPCGLSTILNTHSFLRDCKGNYTILDAPASSGATNTLLFRNSDAGDVAGVYTTSSVTLTYGILSKDTPVPSGLPNFVLFNNGGFASFDILIGGVDVGGTTLGINPRGDTTPTRPAITASSELTPVQISFLNGGGRTLLRFALRDVNHREDQRRRDKSGPYANLSGI